MNRFLQSPDGFVIHHSKTPDGHTLSWPAIRRYHIEANGWEDIGYHTGVEVYDSEYEVLIGRPLDCEGAHCPEDAMNSHTVGVCLVGDFDKAPPPPEQMRVLFERVCSSPWAGCYRFRLRWRR